MWDSPVLLYFLCVLSGFALLRVSLSGTLVGLASLLHIIGLLAIIVFAIVIIVKGVIALFNRL